MRNKYSLRKTILGLFLGVLLIIAILTIVICNMMGKKLGILMGVITVSLLGSWGIFFLYLVEKRVTEFINELCGLLDQIIYGNEELIVELSDISVMERVKNRLKRLNDITTAQRNKLISEKEELQVIISDIAHQVKTPIANLKMINDMLITRNLSVDDINKFLVLSTSQLDKLEFLIQAMVKTSQLESRAITLEKSWYL